MRPNIYYRLILHKLALYISCILTLFKIYTDIIRRKAERFGPNAEEVQEALHEVDDILQSKLTDIKAKNQNADLSVRINILTKNILPESLSVTFLSLLSHYD